MALLRVLLGFGASLRSGQWTVDSDCLRGFATWFYGGLRRCPLARASHLRRGSVKICQL
jgi:hypothetical protein